MEYVLVPDPADLHPNQLARRNRIIESTILLLEKKDYEEIMITTVAKKSHVALGTVYRYFISKEHLFGEAYLVWQQHRYELLRAKNIRVTTEESYVRKIFMESFSELWLHKNMTKILFAIETSTDSNLPNLDGDIEKKMLQILSPVFTDSPSKRHLDIFRTLANSLYVNTMQVNREIITYEEGKRRLTATINLIYKDNAQAPKLPGNSVRKASAPRTRRA